MKEEWFETWFDTSYYHLLYHKRDDQEARQFIDALLHFIGVSHDAKFLDVACGKGRHTIYLNSLGFDATGVDLSENSITEAIQCSQGKVRFEVRDFIEPLNVGKFDVALNLFTSFGYFEKTEDNIKVVKNIAEALRDNGHFIIDYFNLSYVKFHLVENESVKIEQIAFEIKRTFEQDFIVKSIEVRDSEKVLYFKERVRSFSRDDLYEILKAAGLKPIYCFGDYKLTEYASNLPRVIIIAQKMS